MSKKVPAKRSLEPIGAYDPYRPRMFGAADELLNRRHGREVIAMVMVNEAFALEKQREIGERTHAAAERDAINLEASLDAERRARKSRAVRSPEVAP